MRWAEIRVETNAAAHEAVVGAMIRHGCGGAAIIGEAPVSVLSYLPVDDQLEERLRGIRKDIQELSVFGIDPGAGGLTVTYVEDDWAESWKQYFRVTRVGKRIVIKPAWEEYQAVQGEVVVDIEPGMAFGTGAHPTTVMCLEALEKWLRRKMKVVDFGTGSGILAITAAKLGASLVIALDADETAVRAARENVVRNGEEEHIEVHQTDNLKFISGQIDLVVANIVAETIIGHADDLSRVLRKGGILVASGITAEKLLDVEQALRNVGFDITQVLDKDDWVAIIAHKAA